MERDTTSDPWLDEIASFAAAPTPDLEDDRRRAIVTRVVDAIGCALAAVKFDAPEIAAAYARRQPGPHPVWGTDVRTTLEPAALANGTAVRYLDYNDAYYGIESIHPSDVVPTMFAAAQENGNSEAELLDAIAVAYEVAMEGADRIAPRLSGFDHVNVTMVGAAAGLSALLKLTEEQARNAISIAVTSHGAFRQARQGQLSMWKGMAAADACRHAVYCATLAQLGARGPGTPFTGTNAFFRRALQLEPDAFPTMVLPARSDATRIAMSQIKRFPCGVVGQGPVEAALALVDRGIRLADIASLDVRVSPKAAFLMVSPEKMEPKTRETADHSIPFVLATTLKRGRLDVSSFDDANVLDEQVHAFLRSNLTVSVEPEFDIVDDSMVYPIRLTATMSDGRVEEQTVTRPLGSPGNPMQREHLKAKFDSAVEGSPLAGRVADLWDAGWSLGTEDGAMVELSQLLSA